MPPLTSTSVEGRRKECCRVSVSAKNDVLSKKSEAYVPNDGDCPDSSTTARCGGGGRTCGEETPGAAGHPVGHRWYRASARAGTAARRVGPRVGTTVSVAAPDLLGRYRHELER